MRSEKARKIYRKLTTQTIPLTKIMNTLAINDPKFAITPTGIEFHEELSFDEWDDTRPEARSRRQVHRIHHR